MNKSSLKKVFAALLALCAAQVFAAHTEVTKAPRLPFMRGMGFDGYYGSRNRTWMTQPGVYSGLVAKGFDHVRLPVDFRDYATYDSGTGKATLKETTSSWFSTGPGFSTFDTVITNAINAGLYITLDFHGWFDINTTNQSHRAQFKALWRAVAERYKDYPNQLIFELANEPRVNNTTMINALNSLQKETVSIIRETNPTRLILYAVADANQPWALTIGNTPPNYAWVSYPAKDNNLALVIHCYNPGVFTHQGETWANPSYTNQVRLTNSHRTTLNWDLNQLTLFRKDHAIPLVMNEYNVSSKKADHGDITEYLSIVTRYCETNGIPWSPWIYYSDSTGGMNCFSGYGANAVMLDYVEAGLFPDLKTTDKFSTGDYPHRVEITFSGYTGSSALANFPVLVKLSESLSGFHYYDFTRADGFDLCFTDASGNLIPHEIDTWNPNGESTVWVKVPSLTASTKIVARYGCAKPIVPKVESVWDENYVGVWHMGEQKLPLADSSNVSRDVTSADGTGIGYGAAGVVGGSVDFGAADSARSVNMDDHNALDGFKKLTVEAWTKQEAHTKNGGIVSKRKQIGDTISYYMFDSGTGTEMKYTADGATRVSAGVTLSPVMGQWNHQAFSLDSTASSSNSKGYLNGVNKGTASVALNGGVFAGASELHVGNLDSFNATNFPGLVDEVRISKCVRSADWIKASYDTVAKADFATYAVDGVEPPEPDPGPVEYGPLATNQYAKSMNVLFAGAPSDATLTDFPVLVKLSTAIDGFSYGDFARPNGGDLRFADANGNLLPHEIDTWNSNGVSAAWVKVPALTRGTAITAHYGFTGTGDPAPVAPKDVWDSNYVGVWHLGEPALPLKESTGVSTPFASKTGTASCGATGAVGGSVDFTAAKGTESFLTAADDDDLDGFNDFTVEMWTCQDSFYNANEAYAGTLVKRNARADNESWFTYQDKATLKPGLAFGNDSAASDRTLALANSLPATGAWTHQAFVRTVGTSKVVAFMDGTSSGTTVKSSGSVFAGSAPLMLGGGGGQKSFPGRIDEVRISKTARSAAWVKATHDTVADASFAVCSFGEIDLGDSIADLRLKASTDKANPVDYVEGEQIRFDFRLDGVQTLPLEVRAKSPLYVVWTRTADDGVTEKGTNTISLAQGCSVTTSLAVPGIVKMTAALVGSDYKAFEYTANGKKQNVSFIGGAGVATDKMQLSTMEPADFNQFWEEAKAKLAAVPFDGSNVEVTEVFPASSATNTYRYYAVKIPSLGRPANAVTGWLTVPKNASPRTLAAKATFDGYSAAIAKPSLPTDRPGTGVMLFHVNAHGYDLVGRDAQYYSDFVNLVNPPTHPVFPGSPRPYSHGLDAADYDNPTNAYFYFMALRVVRAFDYLKSRPEWNGRDLVAEGGSQGGLQTVWAGALVEGISKIRPSVPWGCDIGNSLNASGPFLSCEWGIPNVPGAYYFDAALHAKRIPSTCTAEITRVGLGDYTCPPRGVLLCYRNMKCQASAMLVQGADHSDSSVPPQPNQVFTLSKDPVVETAAASDAAGYDWTNRLVTVTGLVPGESVKLEVSGPAGATTTLTAMADANGDATFNVATAPGTAYSYAVSRDGTEVAAGRFFTGGWNGAGTLFSASPDGSGGSVEKNGLWVSAPSGTNAASYVIGGNADFALSDGAAAAAGGNLVCVDAAVRYDFFNAASSLSAADLAGRIAGLTVATAGGAARWMFGTGDGWELLHGGPSPQLATPYVLRMESDFAAVPPRIRCSVSDDGGANFAVLSGEDGCVWHNVDGSSLSGAGFDGHGVVSSLGGALANANVAEADGVGYASLADAIAASTNTLALLTNATWPTNAPIGTITVDRGGYALNGVTLDGNSKVVVQSGYSAIPSEGRVNITLAQASALGVATSGKTPAQIASALAANGANGIPLWKSYVLGLDPTKADAKPRATIAMDGGNVELALVGIDVNAASGATVTYKVYRFGDLAEIADAEPVGGDRAVDATAELQKGASEDRMFYRLTVDVRGY